MQSNSLSAGDPLPILDPQVVTINSDTGYELRASAAPAGAPPADADLPALATALNAEPEAIHPTRADQHRRQPSRAPVRYLPLAEIQAIARVAFDDGESIELLAYSEADGYLSMTARCVNLVGSMLTMRTHQGDVQHVDAATVTRFERVPREASF
jgi:hypothetical protein